MIPNTGRSTLIEWFREFDFKVGVELGVDEGKLSRKICKANPQLKLYCVDAWENYDDYTDRLNKRDLPAKFLKAQERLKGYNVRFIRKYSMKAVRKFKKESLDFVYIDANHNLPYVMDDIIYWSQRVRPGGIVAGHDWVRYSSKRPTKIRVKKAVQWYTMLKPIPIWFVLGREAKVDGEIRDNSRTWMFVK